MDGYLGDVLHSMPQDAHRQHMFVLTPATCESLAVYDWEMKLTTLTLFRKQSASLFVANIEDEALGVLLPTESPP